uniref:Uncharacterized protein n=1 Tax=Kalanchoe fedtschenkoi TaxID=63787 RepID=A0A7N0V0E0_KALFE
MVTMVREKERVARPVPLKQLGTALAISFVGYLYSRFQTRHVAATHSTDCKENKNELDAKGSRVGGDDSLLPALEAPFTPKAIAGLSPCSNKSDDTDRFLLPEFHDLIKEYESSGFSPKKHTETPTSNIQSQSSQNPGPDEYELEIKHLNNMVRVLRERERNLEIQLLEYYGLKEQETAMMELQNRLKINGMEAQLFAIKTESLQADNRRLEALVADCSKAVGELEAARAKIKMLKRKLRFEAEQSKQQILALQKKFENLQDQEQKALAQDQEVRAKLQKLQELEIEAEELRMSNTKLQQENSDLALRLQLAEVSVVEEQEAGNLKAENERLKQKNKDLGQEIEQLQADRCADAEELVYLRWVNACLRYELRFNNSEAGKTVAMDLSKSLSPKSAERAKKLILKYATTEGVNDRESDLDSELSSLASFPTESGNVEDSFIGDNSSLNTINNANEPKFLSKLRKFLKIKHESRNAQAKSEKIVTSAGDSMHAYPSESESSQCSSSTSTATEANRFATPQSSCDMDDVKDLTSLKRTNTDCSSYRSIRYSSARTSMSDDLTPSSDLLKYAEALRESRSTIPLKHKKSKSFSAFFTR